MTSRREARVIAILLLSFVLMNLLVPCIVFADTPDGQGTASSPLVTSTTATPVMPTEDKGNFLERSIAGLINNIADALNSVIYWVTGLNSLNDILFTLPANWSDEMNPAPLDEGTWSMLNKLYGGMATVAFGLFMLLPLVASFRFIGGAFNKSPRQRAEAMQTLWRMVIAAVGVGSIPILFRMFLVVANAVQGLIAAGVINSYAGSTLDISDGFLNNIHTGSVILTSIVRMGFVYIGVQIAVLYAVRKIVLATMYVFTPLMLVLWVIKKDITAASVWVGEMLTNSFMLSAYALSAGVVSFIIGGNQSWVLKLLAVFMIVPLGNTLRNGLQNLFTRWAGVDEERIAGGFTGALASAFGLQSITRMVNVMGMTIGGSTGGPGGGGTGGVGGPIEIPGGGLGSPWGQGGTITPSGGSRPIGFQIPHIPSMGGSGGNAEPIPSTTNIDFGSGAPMPSTDLSSLTTPENNTGFGGVAGYGEGSKRPIGFAVPVDEAGEYGNSGMAPNMDELMKRNYSSSAPQPPNVEPTAFGVPTGFGNSNTVPEGNSIPNTVDTSNIGTPYNSEVQGTIPVSTPAGDVKPMDASVGSSVNNAGSEVNRINATAASTNATIGTGATVPTSIPQEVPTNPEKERKVPVMGRGDVFNAPQPTPTISAQSKDNTAQRQVNQEHVKRIQKLHTVNKVAHTSGTVAGMVARGSSIVGYSHPMTRPIAEGVSNGIEWVTRQSVYTAGLFTQAYGEYKDKVAGGEKTNIFREALNLNKEYQQALRHQMPQTSSQHNTRVPEVPSTEPVVHKDTADQQQPTVSVPIPETIVQQQQSSQPDPAEVLQQYIKIGQVDDPDKVSKWM